MLTPTPSATSAPTITQRPTPPLVPWKPGETFSDAQRTVTVAYRGIFNFLIWLVVVVLPILLPPAIVIWLLWKVFTRKTNKPSGGGSSDQSAKSEE